MAKDLHLVVGDQCIATAFRDHRFERLVDLVLFAGDNFDRNE